jgi:toxin HigB-1
LPPLRCPAGGFNQLTGNRAGHWSLTVTGNWRLIVRFESGDACDLDLIDYH